MNAKVLSVLGASLWIAGVVLAGFAWHATGVFDWSAAAVVAGMPCVVALMILADAPCMRFTDGIAGVWIGCLCIDLAAAWAWCLTQEGNRSWVVAASLASLGTLLFGLSRAKRSRAFT